MKSGPFYIDSLPRDPSMKNAVYLGGITPPLWVAINEDEAREGAQRLNSLQALGGLRGWDTMNEQHGRLRGWTVSDLIAAARGGELSRDVITRASTLIQAIATVANGKQKLR